MSISIKEFNEGNFTVMRGKALKVLGHFRSNRDKAYTSKEIAELMDCSQPAINPTLKKLVKDGLLDKKVPYYALSKADKEKPVKVLKVKEEPAEPVESVEPYEGEDAEPEPLQ